MLFWKYQGKCEINYPTWKGRGLGMGRCAPTAIIRVKRPDLRETYPEKELSEKLCWKVTALSAGLGLILNFQSPSRQITTINTRREKTAHRTEGAPVLSRASNCSVISCVITTSFPIAGWGWTYRSYWFRVTMKLLSQSLESPRYHPIPLRRCAFAPYRA